MSVPMLPCSFAKLYNCNYTTPATLINPCKALKELELHHASHFKEEKENSLSSWGVGRRLGKKRDSSKTDNASLKLNDGEGLEKLSVIHQDGGGGGDTVDTVNTKKTVDHAVGGGSGVIKNLSTKTVTIIVQLKYLDFPEEPEAKFFIKIIKGLLENLLSVSKVRVDEQDEMRLHNGDIRMKVNVGNNKEKLDLFLQNFIENFRKELTMERAIIEEKLIEEGITPESVERLMRLLDENRSEMRLLDENSLKLNDGEGLEKLSVIHQDVDEDHFAEQIVKMEKNEKVKSPPKLLLLIRYLEDIKESKLPFSQQLEEFLKMNKCDGFKELFENLSEQIEIDITCMILYQICPAKDTQLKYFLQSQTKMELSIFNSLKEVYIYVKELLLGTYEETKTTVCVIGNTDSGKSSLVGNLKRYCDNPTQTPKPFLTGDSENKEFCETKVLQLVENVEVKRNHNQLLKITTECDKLQIISFDPSQKSKDEEKNEKLQITFFDMGGHSEYFACIPLFMKEKGVFMLCFEGDKFLQSDEPITANEYFPAIGTFLDRVCENCPSPIFLLTATKMDDIDKQAMNNERMQKIHLEVKKHLINSAKRSTSDKPIFILDEIIQSSSKMITKTWLDSISHKLVEICSHPELMGVKSETIPMSWKNCLDKYKSQTKVLISDIQDDYRSLQHDYKNEDIDSDKMRHWMDIIEMFMESQSLTQEDTIVHLQENEIFINQPDDNDSINGNILQIDKSNEIEGTVNEETNEEGNEKINETVNIMLKISDSSGVILWFRTHESLGDIIIPVPMNLITLLRIIIRHDVRETLEDLDHTILKTQDITDLMDKGLMTERCFQALVSIQNKNNNLSEKEIWDFLVQLNLATEIKEPRSLFIPSLTCSGNEGFIRNQLKQFTPSEDSVEDSVGFHYSFQKTNKTSNLFNNLLSKLADKKEFFYKTQNPGISFTKSYSAKIENREVGLVAGLYGAFKWTDSPLSSIQQTVDFLVLEYDLDNHKDMYTFARHKGIRVYLKPQSIDHRAFPFHAIGIFDNIIKEIAGESFDRLLICNVCAKECRDSYFQSMGPGFQPQNSMEKCSGLCIDNYVDNHAMSETQKSLRKNKVNYLGAFLKDGIKNIPKRPFKNVRLELERGDQVWLYRDEDNFVSRVMPYAHVLVWLGDSEGNVVHVTKNKGFWQGIMTGTFEKISIDEIIKNEKDKENQLVFLGHEIPEIGHAFNMRNTIVERALACADPQQPKLVFDYDHKLNCEAFANVLTGAADVHADVLGAQEEKTPFYIEAIFHIIRGLKFYRSKKCLTRVVEERLKNKK